MLYIPQTCFSFLSYMQQIRPILASNDWIPFTVGCPGGLLSLCILVSRTRCLPSLLFKISLINQFFQLYLVCSFGIAPQLQVCFCTVYPNQLYKPLVWKTIPLCQQVRFFCFPDARFHLNMLLLLHQFHFLYILHKKSYNYFYIDWLSSGKTLLIW